MPTFDIEGGLLLALVRGAWDASLLSLLGTLAFRVLVAPRTLARAGEEVSTRVHQVLDGLGWWSLGVAGPALLAWGWLQAAEIADKGDLAALAAVGSGTVFGHVLLLQLAGLCVTAALLSRSAPARPWAALAAAAAITALHAGHGHALALEDGPSVLLAVSVVHLLAAGAWLGGLLPLLLVVRVAPARTGAAAARWFSPLGKWCVGLMAGTAVVQFLVLIGGLPGLLGTSYGWTAAAKLILFAVLFGFAWVNRYRFAPRLLGAAGEASRPVLRRSIAVQTGFGLLVVLAAAVLSSLPPSVHEQPVWPFPLRPSLVALSDPDLRGEVVRGTLEVAGGALLVLVGMMLWRRRMPALAAIGAGLLVGSASASHLDLLLVEAYPTSYYASPTGFAATSISRGSALFPQNCASCHGADGRGDGPAAAGLPVPPADLTAAHLWEHADGELFWWLTHGIEAPEGGMAMPGFADRLTEDDRWALIDFIRAHNAGTGLRDTGSWATPVQAPGFGMTCPGRGAVTTEDLRGSVLHVVVPGPEGGPVPPAPERSPVPVVTVLLGDIPLPAVPGACVNTDPVVRTAFAAISGVPAPQLDGAQFLVDPNGWMRAVQRPGETTVRWADPALLLADVRAICRTPIAAPTGGHHH